MITILIKEYRYKNHLTLWQLQELSGIGKTTINNIEKGIQSPTLDTLERLAKALDCKIKDLFLEI